MSYVLCSQQSINVSRWSLQAIWISFQLLLTFTTCRYLFLVERAHILRAPYAPRYKDLLWLLSTIAIIVCLGAICIVGIVSPKYVLSEVDGRCRIGLQRYAAIPLLTCDIVINLYLTTVFIYLLSPLVKDNTSSGTGVVNRVTLCISKTLGRVQQKATMDLHRSNKALVKRVETLLQKTLIGCVLVILPTGGNLAAICILVGKELAFVSSGLDDPNEASRSNILFLDLPHFVHL